MIYWYVTNELQRESTLRDIRHRRIGDYGFKVEITIGKRTLLQNSAIHKYFSLLANTLNEAGLDMFTVLDVQIRPEIMGQIALTVPWTSGLIKNNLWRPIQIAMLGKVSTKDLERQEINKVYRVLDLHLSEKFGVTVAFPSRENDGRIE